MLLPSDVLTLVCIYLNKLLSKVFSYFLVLVFVYGGKERKERTRDWVTIVCSTIMRGFNSTCALRLYLTHAATATGGLPMCCVIVDLVMQWS